ncbi:hypothetical protein ACFQMM_03490 [Saliphagus sp. GCM10025308]
MKIELPDGEVAEFEDVDFDTVSEEWNEYELEDGTSLKVKLVLQKVMRAEDKYTPAGEPIYQISSQNVVRTSDVPDELMANQGDE